MSDVSEVTSNSQAPMEAPDREANTSSSGNFDAGKRLRSAVWHFFTISIEVVGTSQCTIWSDVVKHANNTSNLFKHLKLKHPAQHKEAENQRKEEEEKASKRHKTTDNLQQHTISEMTQTWQKYSPTCARSKNIDQALIRMIAINMQPATIVEDTGFQSLVCLLDSWYQLSSRRHIMRSLLPDMYITRAGEIKRELLQISHVAVTSDLWTSRTVIIAITCHFVTSTWELKFLVLAMFGLKKDHTTEHIAASFPKVAEEWGVSRKVVAMVTDNATNIVAAVRHTGWTHVPCFAHTLNLVVSEAIKAETKIHQLRKSCRDIVSFFHFSIEASEKLKEIQLQLGIPENKLIQEVIPPANSRQCLTGAITEKDTPLVSNLSYQMRHRFTNIESACMLAMSTFLDPQMKKLAFSDSPAMRQAEQWVVQEMSGHVQTNDSNEDRQPSNTTEAAGLWDLFDSVVQQSTSQRTSTSNATLEARKYFEEPVLARLQDPSLWWKENERYYELIAKIAKKYLCIPGTSVPAKRVFSKVGELVSMRRNQLKPKIVNIFLFLNKNI
ncbi:hypothetical protein pdam_00023626 [Pocillopora damicornis]|uniref:HAT C-terminal dimerisation domain-containing protein n=1 Tax=Pocillopora damicornis TaxID=46731 RepID=A0A3M6UVN0_POCDA|nr:hypothetical protein pdam_00023626 [Pocillopora damicornis]